jgi:hypothetical protein
MSFTARAGFAMTNSVDEAPDETRAGRQNNNIRLSQACRRYAERSSVPANRDTLAGGAWKTVVRPERAQR